MTTKPLYADPERVAKVKIDPEKNAVIWRARAYSVLADYAPRIYECADCSNPVLHGYQCTWCGSTYPER